MLPSALAVTTNELCHKLIKGVYNYVTGHDSWKEMFKVPERNPKRYTDESRNPYVVEAWHTESPTYSPVAPRPVTRDDPVPTSIRLTFTEIIKETRDQLPEVANCNELEAKTKELKQQLRIAQQSRSIALAQEALQQEQDRSKEKDSTSAQQEEREVTATSSQGTTNVAAAGLTGTLPTLEKYKAKFHRLLREPPTPGVETIKVAINEGEREEDVVLQCQSVDYCTPTPPLVTGHEKSHVVSLDPRNLPASFELTNAKADSVVQIINRRNEHEARHFGCTTCLKCGFFVPKIELTDHHIMAENPMGGCTHIVESRQENAPLVYRHDCSRSNDQDWREQQALTFRHHAILKFGRKGIHACLCGKFHEKNELCVVKNKFMVINEPLVPNTPETRTKIEQDLLVLYCREARMFYPICLNQASEISIKGNVLKGTSRISPLLRQHNMEGPGDDQVM